MLFGPPIDKATFHPIDFCEWLNDDEVESNTYGLPDVVRFLDEKEHREGTAMKSQEQAETTMATYEERRDKRFHEATIATLHDIEQRLGTIEPSDDPLHLSVRYAAMPLRMASCEATLKPCSPILLKHSVPTNSLKCGSC